jgi:hypothetical protein
MIVVASVLSYDMEILKDVNVLEVATGKATRTDTDGKFFLNVQNEDSDIRFSHAAYDYDTIKAGDIESVVTLYPKTLDGVTVQNNYKAPDNTAYWIMGGIAAAFAAFKLLKKQPRKVKV